MDGKSKETILKRISSDKEKLLENLKQVPIIQVSCQKLSISRATYYRWRKKDKKFARKADGALQEGRQLINEMAESQLINAIKEQNMTGIIFWLKNNNPIYSEKVELTHRTDKDELSTEQKASIERAIKLTQGEKFKQ